MKLKRRKEEDFDDDLEDEFETENIKEDSEIEPNDDEFKDDDDFLDEYGEGSVEVPLNKHSDLLKNLTNFDPYLKDSFNNWLGLMWDEQQGKFVSNPLIKPIMNIKGAAWCNGLSKTYTRGNNIITDIRSEEYKNMMSDHIEAIWLNLATREDLGIKEDGDIIRVANEMEHSAALVLMGAGDGKYNKFLGSTYSYHGNPAENREGYGYPQQPMVTKDNALSKLRRLVVGK